MMQDESRRTNNLGDHTITGTHKYSLGRIANNLESSGPNVFLTKQTA